MMAALGKDNNINTYINSLFLFRTVNSHRLFENKTRLRVLYFGWPHIRAKDNRKHAEGRLKAGATAE